MPAAPQPLPPPPPLPLRQTRNESIENDRFASENHYNATNACVEEPFRILFDERIERGALANEICELLNLPLNFFRVFSRSEKENVLFLLKRKNKILFLHSSQSHCFFLGFVFKFKVLFFKLFHVKKKSVELSIHYD